MNTGWHITTNDIKDWTNKNKRRSEETLPELIEKLIRSSGKPKYLDFPSGDSVTVGGWDGILEIEEGNEYIPVGKSVWEFGTEESVNTKANEDYKKRTEQSGYITPSETTFVFVTSRHWKDKNLWCSEKNKEKKWKNVKGINADDLKSWLSQCPPVHRWLAEIIGKITAPVWDIQQAWDSWANSTSIPASLPLVLNGRTEQSQDLTKRLTENTSIIHIKSESTNESYAFCLATLIEKPDFSSRVLIIKDQTQWDILINTKNSLILIPQNFVPENIGYAKQKGHFVLIPEGLYSQNQTLNEVNIPRMSRNNRIKALQSMGLNEDQASKIYSDTKGYLSVIRINSTLGPHEQLSNSKWLEVNSNILTTALLATEWDRQNESDKNALSRLAGISYEK